MPFNRDKPRPKAILGSTGDRTSLMEVRANAFAGRPPNTCRVLDHRESTAGSPGSGRVPARYNGAESRRIRHPATREGGVADEEPNSALPNP